MNKHEQVIKLAKAAHLIREVEPHTAPLVASELEIVIAVIVELADAIEKSGDSE